MTIASLKIESSVTARQEVLAAQDVRTLIARQLGVDVKRILMRRTSLMILGPTGSTAWN
jgi:hypothetical protein